MTPSFKLPLLLFALAYRFSLFAPTIAAHDVQVARSERTWRSTSSRNAPALVPGRSLYIRGSVPSGWTCVFISTPSVSVKVLTSASFHSEWMSSQTGCFTDATNLRTLTGYSSSTSTNTISACLNTCQGLGFSLGGVEYGTCPQTAYPYLHQYQDKNCPPNVLRSSRLYLCFSGLECYCGNSMTVSSNPSTGQTTVLSDCSTVCAGDSSQTCGGGNRIMVYTSPNSGTTTSSSAVTTTSAASSTWTSLGCYTDASSRILVAYSTTSSSLTTSSCQNTCSGLGYSYAGTEYSMFLLLTADVVPIIV